MTLEKIKEMECETITPAIAAAVIGCNEQAIRTAVCQDPDSVNFPFLRLGNRTYIIRRPFLTFMESGEPWFSRRKNDNKAISLIVEDVVRKVVQEELSKIFEDLYRGGDRRAAVRKR